MIACSGSFINEENVYPVEIIDWKKGKVVRVITKNCHFSWINVVKIFPFYIKDDNSEFVKKYFVISGSADGSLKVFHIFSGKLYKENNESNMVVMHGMKLFSYEAFKKGELIYKFFLVSAGFYESESTYFFKIWTN